MNVVSRIAGGLLGVVACVGSASAAAEARPLVSTPELVITREGGTETLAMPGSAYRDFIVEGQQASFVIEGQALPAGEKTLRGRGIAKVSWEPQGTGKKKHTLVSIEFSCEPGSTLVNAVTGTPDRPQTPQVLAGFIFPQERGGRTATPSVMGDRDAAQGDYELPPFPDVHYSDALVTLKVVNADFRDVLSLLCRIGGVSYAIDPYYEDEPTGNIRSGKGSGSGGNTGGGPGGQPGFPQDGTGSITLNFKEVPFDQALDLLLETAGLVKTDIY